MCTIWLTAVRPSAATTGKPSLLREPSPVNGFGFRSLTEKSAWARSRLEEVITPAPTRVTPPCPHFAECGGCQWQHMAYSEQLKWKSSIVAGQLRHLGGVVRARDIAPIVAPGAPYGYRNRMTFHVVGGRAGLYRLRSKEQIPVSACLLLAPDLADLYGRLGALSGVHEVTLRLGVTTGERAVLIRGQSTRPRRRMGSFGCSPGRAEIRARDRAALSSTRKWQAFASGSPDLPSSRSTRPAPNRLSNWCKAALQPSGSDTLLDAYAGVGLFAATVGKSAGRVIAVESSGVALADLRHNLEEAGVAEQQVVRGRFEEVAPATSWSLAVCDPPRTGLGQPGVRPGSRGGPRRIAYVSCDPASLARDTRLLDSAGYRLGQGDSRRPLSPNLPRRDRGGVRAQVGRLRQRASERVGRGSPARFRVWG